MRVYQPDIFRKFYCTGSQCRDNCCTMGWDIEIDDSTYKYYKSLDDDMGRELIKNISCEDGCHYIMQKNGGCPFLNEKGLCSVLLRYGEDKISEICANHPRFFEWFGGYKEAGTGLCCEKSAQLWLEGDKITFTHTQTDEADDDLEFDEKQLSAVLDARQMLFDIVCDREMSFSDRLALLLSYACEAQNFLDYEENEEFGELTGVYANKKEQAEILAMTKREFNKSDYIQQGRKILSYFENLDYINKDFPDSVRKMSQRLEEIYDNACKFNSENPQCTTQYEHLLVYYIYRYFIKTTRDYDAASKLIFAVVSLWFTYMCDIMEYTDGKFDFERQILIVKEYSKEIEYSADNMDRICEDIYTDSIFSCDCIMKLVKGW